VFVISKEPLRKVDVAAERDRARDAARGWGGAWRQRLRAGRGLFRRTSVTFAQIDRSPSARATAMR
jgi:hypothetical protein